MIYLKDWEKKLKSIFFWGYVILPTLVGCVLIGWKNFFTILISVTFYSAGAHFIDSLCFAKKGTPYRIRFRYHMVCLLGLLGIYNLFFPEAFATLANSITMWGLM